MWHSAVSYTQLMVSEVPRMDRKQCRDCHTIYINWDHSVSCCLKPTKLILLESLLTEVCIMSVFAWTYFFQGWWEPRIEQHFSGTVVYCWTRKLNWSRGHMLAVYVFLGVPDAPTHYETLDVLWFTSWRAWHSGDQKKKIPNFHFSKDPNWWTLDNDFSYKMKAMILRRKEKRRWCSGITQDSHSCNLGSIPGRRRSRGWKELLQSSIFWDKVKIKQHLIEAIMIEIMPNEWLLALHHQYDRGVWPNG